MSRRQTTGAAATGEQPHGTMSPSPERCPRKSSLNGENAASVLRMSSLRAPGAPSFC